MSPHHGAVEYNSVLEMAMGWSFSDMQQNCCTMVCWKVARGWSHAWLEWNSLTYNNETAAIGSGDPPLAKEVHIQRDTRAAGAEIVTHRKVGCEQE